MSYEKTDYIKYKKEGVYLDKLIAQIPYITDRSSIGSDKIVALFHDRRKIAENDFNSLITYLFSTWPNETKKAFNNPVTNKQPFRIWDYDVWGNEKEGFEVNNKWATNFVILINGETSTDAEIIRAMIKEGYLKESVNISKFRIDGDIDTLYVDYDGAPFCELRYIGK